MGVRGAEEEEEEGRAELVTADTEGAKVGGKGAKNVGRNTVSFISILLPPLFAKKRGEVRAGLLQNSLPPPQRLSLSPCQAEMSEGKEKCIFSPFPPPPPLFA